MDPDDQLAKKVNIYQELGKADPKIDVGMLMINALQNQRQNMVSAKAKRWLYLISISVPPVGLLFWLYYYFSSDKEDAKSVAWICFILTIVCLLAFWIMWVMLFSAAGTTPQQIEQIKPSDIQQILQ